MRYLFLCWMCIYLCIFTCACTYKQDNYSQALQENEHELNNVENEKRFSWIYDVYMPDVGMGLYREEGQLVRSTTYEGSPLKFGIKMRIYQGEFQAIDCGIIVLVDGIPELFTPENETSQLYFHTFSVLDEATQVFTITPTFTNQMGRIDIIIVTDINNLYGDSAVLPVYVENKVSDHNEVKSNVITTEKLMNETQSPPKDGSDMVDWWLWSKETESDIITNQSGAIEISLGSNELLYCSTTGLGGRLRTAFFLDYKPFNIYNELPFIDWTLKYGEMLSFPITFPQIDTPNILLTVTTRMDDDEMKYENIMLRRVLITP